MPAQLRCPQCDSAFPYSPNVVGRRVRCKACEHIFVVTVPEEEPPRPESDAPEPPPLAIPEPPATPPPAPPAPPKPAAPPVLAPPPPNPPKPAAPPVLAPPPPEPPLADDTESRPRTAYHVESPARGFGGSRSGDDRPPAPRASDGHRRSARDDYEEEERAPPRRKAESPRRARADEDVDPPRSRGKSDTGQHRHRERDEEEFDDDIRPARRTPAHFERSSGIGLLLALTIAAVVVFLFVAAVLGFCLWP